MRMAVSVLIFFFNTVLFALPLKNIVVFGDSLSDNGNLYEYMQHQLPQSPPYYQGRFTDGLLWVEQLINLYYPNQVEGHLLDYAFGGAGVSDKPEDEVLFTLKREIDSYFLAHENKADPDSLFVVWIGANNYLGVPDDVDLATSEVTEGIAHGLERLVDAGAKHILVMNIPDLGKTPAARLFEAEAILSQASQAHNEKLNAVIARLKQQHPEVQWLFYDINQLLSTFLDDPQTYGFSNITDTCYDLMGNPTDNSQQQSLPKMVAKIKAKSGTNTCEGYLFFDPVHPVARAHTIMAQHAYQLLQDAGIEFKK